MSQLDIQRWGRPWLSLKIPHFPFTIGRHPENDLRLDDDLISNYHAVFESQAEALSFRDHSRNGSKIDGHILQNHTLELSTSHKIEIGHWTLTFTKEIASPELIQPTIEKKPSELEEETRIIQLDPVFNFAKSMRSVIHITSETEPEKIFYVRKRRNIIGTGTNCDIKISDPFVSREHIEITVCGDGLKIRDLDSRNGTWSGEVKIREMIIRENKKIKIGNITLGFQLVEEDCKKIIPLPQKNLCGLVGSSEIMRQLYAKLKIVAETDMTALLQGETGTGKEMAAQAIHNLSRRSENKFAVINCAAIPSGLLESELFGTEKGAFTGAEQRRAGAFEWASGGTLFLDEIGELPLDMQAKILRVLEYQTLRRLGGNDELGINTRLIAATHRNLHEMVVDGKFRQDLYFRLNVVPIILPSLREHKEDIPELCEHLLHDNADKIKISPEALTKLYQHDWPGNVRELKNTLLRAQAFCRDHTLQTGDIELEKRVFEKKSPPPQEPQTKGHERSNILEKLNELEREQIEAALFKTGGDKKAAALHLGIGRSTLYKRMEELAIAPPRKRKNWSQLLSGNN